jgi:hypothetical protein
MRHDLLDPVQRVVVADPVHQPGQRRIGRVAFLGTSGDGLVEAGRCRFDVVVET